MTTNPIFLTPRPIEGETFPFRRVWRTAWLEAIILLLLTTSLLLALRFLPITIGPTLRRAFGVGFALLPLGLWYLISFRGERRAPQPRTRLFTVVILGALVASGVALPVTERLFAVEDWLTTAEGLSRIIGYMFTVGILQEFLKYAVMRYSLWPDAFRARIDGIAYAMATAVGYATALNMNFVLSGDLELSALALRITETTLAQVALSTIMGYCLVELKNPNVFVLMIPFGLLLSGALAGLAIVFRAGLVVGSAGVSTTANNATFGLGMAVFLIVALYSTISFLINSADDRDSLRTQPE